MIQLDPTIMRRSLPPNIHATIDQVTTNVSQAVDTIIQQFKANAEQTVRKFEQRQFTAELNEALDKAKAELARDLGRWDDELQQLRNKAAQAAQLARNADMKAAELAPYIAELTADAGQLQQRLGEFREKVNTFAEKSGGLIASTALKSFTGGVA